MNIRMCPECGDLKKAEDFIDLGARPLCFSCHSTETKRVIDERAERIRLRQKGRCIARTADGYLCGAPATVIGERGMLCEEHAPRRH